MADIFTTKHIKNLLTGKFILILGDSNMRAVYRDIIWLLNNNKIVPESHLRRKLDFSYIGDRLIKQGELNRGRDYLEMREYLKDEFQIKFNFITRCITKEVEDMIQDFKDKKTRAPDVILINSCLWDIARWGPDGVSQYKENMRKLFSLIKASLPPTTLVIFSTTPPVSQSCSAAFLVKQVEFMKHSLRFEVMEANLFVRQLVPTYGYNILDLHYHLRMQIHRRCKDGVHWIPLAVRHMTNLFMTHIALSWDVPLPGNFEGKSLDRMKSRVKSIKDIGEDLPKLSMVKDPTMPPPPLPEKRKRWKNTNQERRADIENIPPKIRFPTRYPQHSAPRYGSGRQEQTVHENSVYTHRPVFSQVDPNVIGSMILLTDGGLHRVPIQNEVFAPYCDYQPYVGAYRHGRSYNGSGHYGKSYGSQRYRNNHHYASYTKPY